MKGETNALINEVLSPKGQILLFLYILWPLIFMQLIGLFLDKQKQDAQ